MRERERERESLCLSPVAQYLSYIFLRYAAALDDVLQPVTWAGDQAPITIVGSSNWSDVAVSVSVQVENAHAQPWVGARIVGRQGDPAPAGPQDDTGAFPYNP